jgi:hypothetical protein
MRVNINRRNVGVNFIETGEAEIVVWSPLAKSVDVITNEKKIALTNELGYWKKITRNSTWFKI